MAKITDDAENTMRAVISGSEMIGSNVLVFSSTSDNRLSVVLVSDQYIHYGDLV